jgi:hypothetical protein
MRIVPVNFNTEHKAMLGHCKMILENDGVRIAINPDRFDKLITAFRVLHFYFIIVSYNDTDPTTL